MCLVAVLGLSGCRHLRPEGDGRQTAAETGGITSPTSLGTDTPPVRPEDIQARLNALTLADIVDIALKNNPSTRGAWADAQAAAARLAVAKADYYPVISADGSVARSKPASPPSNAAEASTTYGGALSLSYLLLDFGGRSASVESVREGLVAAERMRHAAMQDVMLQVETAYFRYLATQSLMEAQEASLREAQTNLNVATERNNVGLGTIADVLQARTVVSRAQLSLQSTAGSLQTTRGALALSMGFPANMPYDVQAAPRDIPVQGISTQVEALIGQAVLRRPELAAERARLLAAQAHIRELRSRNWPALQANGNVGWTYFVADSGGEDSYGGALTLHVPVFTGFAQKYSVKQAEWEAMSEAERARALEQQVVYQVYSAYVGLQTAVQQVKTADELLAHAQQAYDVTLARYREGLGTITDLLSAQSLLTDARSQQVGARWSWFTALAQLAHDVGIIGTANSGPLDVMAYPSGEKK